MAAIFVSHSSLDDAQAAALETWLAANGFTDYFMDHASIAGGDKWADALRNATGTCRVVICLMTENWLASAECYAEFSAAWYLGKRIIPLFLLKDEAALSPEAKARLAKVRAEDQGFDLRGCLKPGGVLDISADERISELLTKGLRAAGALSKVGLDPQAFEIDRESRPSPFPGLLSFGDGDADAAIFYGRNREIAGTLEELRKLRANGGQRPFGILGASGAGKSSLLKAGIIPRLRREAPAWLPLRAFRPGADPLLNFAEALTQTMADFGQAEAYGATRDRLFEAWQSAERDAEGRVSAAGLSVLQSLLHEEGERLRRSSGRPEATILIAIDQAEELARAEGESGDALSDFLRAALSAAPASWLIAFTCRTDSFAELQSHRRFQNLDALCYDLRAVPVFRFDAVVEEPAKRYGVTVELALIDALMNDAPKEDALPLLAFALQRIWRQYAATGALVFAQYRNMGGLTGMIEDAAERALRGIEPGQDAPLQKSQLGERLNALGSSTFVPALADVNDKGAVIRRPAAWASFSPDAQELLERFDRWRLVTRRGEEGGTVEVAHEALFNEWPRLKQWLEPERSRLEALRGLKGAGESWERQGKRPDYLSHRGERLRDAIALLERPDYARQLDVRDRAYLDACSAAERSRMRRDFFMRWGLRAAAAGLAAIAAVSVVLWQRAEDQRKQADEQRMRAEAATELAQKNASLAKEERDQIIDLFGSIDEKGEIRADASTTIALLRKQAESGEAYAMSFLGYFYTIGQGVPQDYVKAREWFEKAADQGYGYAMRGIGILYANGQGVPQDYAKAREWYQKAVDVGNVEAMRSMGLLYDNGQGVPQDYVKAREWYEKAADKGDATAMRFIGDFYSLGQGVPLDYAKAREWYDKAIEKGDAAALRSIGVLYEYGQGVPQDYGKAREWYEKAADKGDTTAMRFIGDFYVYAQGVPVDFAKAREWYDKAVDRGDAAAMRAIGMLYDNGQGVPQDFAKAREWYDRAVEKGDTGAMRAIGLQYENGQGVPQDYAKALEWYQKAVDKGDAIAMRFIGVLYDNGEGVTQDYGKALEWYQKAANKGDAPAMRNIGLLYDNGQGVPKDYSKALEWYERAADKGDGPAMRNIGILYDNGQGVPQDYAKAREWYEKAADKGDAIAMRYLGDFYDGGQGVPQDFAKALEWYQKAADKGDAPAMRYIGLFYEGGRGVPQDYAKALEWYQKAADKGDAIAMRFIGVLYENGLGVPQDFAKAREWYQRAADKGDAGAMRAIGYLYDSGEGVPQDYAKALEWYEKAAAKGDGPAMRNIGILYDNGQGVAQDYAKAREWYEKAAAAGDAIAMRYLGNFYENGDGVAQDYVKAREWYEKAADKGDAGAMRAIGLLYESGEGVPQDFGKALEWYEKAADKGDATAMRFIGDVYSNGQGVPKDYAKARPWYEQAARGGDAAAMTDLAGLYANGRGVAQDYCQAFEWRNKSAATTLKQDIAKGGKLSGTTVSSLGSVSWYGLFCKKFSDSLRAAELALKAQPDALWIATNRAHALMFLGKADEARAAYLEHRGAPIPEQDNKKWEAVVLEDFAELEQHGLTNPLMAQIRKLFAASAL